MEGHKKFCIYFNEHLCYMSSLIMFKEFCQIQHSACLTDDCFALLNLTLILLFMLMLMLVYVLVLVLVSRWMLLSVFLSSCKNMLN